MSLHPFEMDSLDYQRKAMRTKCEQEKVVERLKVTPKLIQLLHGVTGLHGDAGELATAMERVVWYGKAFDESVRLNLIEEVGDCLWYLAEICDALGIGMDDVMARNIAKLRARFPDKFDDRVKEEEGRDREAERKALENPQLDSTTIPLFDVIPAHRQEGIPVNYKLVAMSADAGSDEAVKFLKHECVELGIAYVTYDNWAEVAIAITEALEARQQEENTLKEKASGHLCPHCKYPVNDETLRMLHRGQISFGGCPQCNCSFRLVCHTESWELIKD